MIPDLTREELEQLFGDFGRGRDLGYGDQRLLLAHALSEPARLAAARAEGVREGIEMAAGHLEEKAAGFFADRDAHMRAWEASKSSRAEEVHQRRACSAEVVASSLLGWAAKLRALAPAPAEAPTTPTVEASDGWIEWVCRPLVPLGTLVEIECDDGARHGPLPVEGWIWDATGPNPIRAYRIVQPAEASAPVAEGGAGLEQRVAALEAEVAALREGLAAALLWVTDYDDWMDRYPDADKTCFYRAGTTFGELRAADRARALLQGQEPTP